MTISVINRSLFIQLFLDYELFLETKILFLEIKSLYLEIKLFLEIKKLFLENLFLEF
jgi:hypothetical protein